MRDGCNHITLCKECMQQKLKIDIKDDNVTPWLRCPEVNCNEPIHCDILLQLLSIDVKLYFKHTH